MPAELRIPFKLKQLMKVIFVAGPSLIIMGLVFISIGFTNPGFLSKLVTLFGIFVLLFFVPHIVFLIFAILSARPGLILSKEGITDQSQTYTAGFIKWNDIEKISTAHKHEIHFFSIHLHEPELQLQKVNPITRMMLKFTAYLGSSAVTIDATRLKVSGAELLTWIEHYSNGKFLADEIPESDTTEWKV